MNSKPSETCLAILEQGTKKGERCWRPQLEEGYCMKHTAQAKLSKELSEGRKKCLTHRCLITIESTNTEKYCRDCIAKKEEEKKEIKLCKAIKEQHANKGKPCGLKATIGDYCGKHAARCKLLEEAKENGKRICDDGKRSCKEFTKDGNLLCDACLKKKREQEKKIYNERLDDMTVCLTCGKTLDTVTKNYMNQEIQRCQSCYDKSRIIEQNRIRENRILSDQAEFNFVLRQAAVRNIDVSITKEDRKDIISKPCRYCGTIENKRGIDRIDSEKGYHHHNVTSCCGSCNIMKLDMPLLDFAKHIEKIYTHFVKSFLEENTTNNTEDSEEETITNEYETKPSFIKLSKIIGMYQKNTFSEFIELCKKDDRTDLLIKKLEDLEKTRPKIGEFRMKLKNALIADYVYRKKDGDVTKMRINKKELYDFLNKNNISLFKDTYKKTHGNFEGLDKDIDSMAKTWKDLDVDSKKSTLDNFLIKYRNKKAYILSQKEETKLTQ
jgi:hypothetical protein